VIDSALQVSVKVLPMVKMLFFIRVVQMRRLCRQEHGMAWMIMNGLQFLTWPKLGFKGTSKNPCYF